MRDAKVAKILTRKIPANIPGIQDRNSISKEKDLKMIIKVRPDHFSLLVRVSSTQAEPLCNRHLLPTRPFDSICVHFDPFPLKRRKQRCFFLI